LKVENNTTDTFQKALSIPIKTQRTGFHSDLNATRSTRTESAGNDDVVRKASQKFSPVTSAAGKKETAAKISLRRTEVSKCQTKNDQAIVGERGPPREEDPRRVATELPSSDLEIIQLLHQHIAKLESEKTTLAKKALKEEEASRVQIVYEIYCHRRPREAPRAQYFDEPVQYDPSLEWSHLQGRKPFPQNLELFLERQRGAISFLVYKVLECCKLTQQVVNDNSTTKFEGNPHLQERIRVVSSKLQDAATFLKKKYPRELLHFPSCSTDEEIYSPYLFYYHQRDFITKLGSLPRKHQVQIALFRQHVESSFGDEFSRVDSLVSQGLITSEYLPYLFEPGTVVISLKGGCVSGYEQEDWPLSGEFVWKGPYTINAKYWDFNGEFSLKSKQLTIDFGNEPPLYRKPISALDLIPLRFADPIAEQYLRKRGLNFWNCRVRRYMSHCDHLKAHEQLKV
jgi:Domain of unknown function (DUF7025)